MKWTAVKTDVFNRYNIEDEKGHVVVFSLSEDRARLIAALPELIESLKTLYIATNFVLDFLGDTLDINITDDNLPPRMRENLKQARALLDRCGAEMED